jgi:hypothetical protein
VKSFRYKGVILFIAFLTFFLSNPGILLAEDSFSADCAFASVQYEYKHSKAVFVGKVTKVVEGENSKTYEFRVDKYWKGVKGKKIKITAGMMMRFEPVYQRGKTYLIYAFADEKGTLRTGKCTRGGQLEFVQADLKVLGKAKRPG